MLLKQYYLFKNCFFFKGGRGTIWKAVAVHEPRVDQFA